MTRLQKTHLSEAVMLCLGIGFVRTIMAGDWLEGLIDGLSVAIICYILLAVTYAISKPREQAVIARTQNVSNETLAQASSTPRPKHEKAYSPAFYSRIVMYGILAIMLGCLVVSSVAFPWSLPRSATFLMILLLAGFIYLITVRAQLVVSQDGVEYRTLFYNIEANWTDIRCLELTFEQDLLVFNRARVQAGSLMAAWLRITGNDKTIPLSLFARRWRNSELGDDIQQYLMI
jgi:hypothetical protein